MCQTLGIPASAALLLAPLAAAYSGTATYFKAGLGACGNVNGDSDFIVALNSNLWAGGSHCGQQLSITYNGVTQMATVADQCPTCPGQGDLDLTEGLFTSFADTSLGVLSISWEWGSGAAPEPDPTSSDTPEAEPTWSPETTENTWTEQQHNTQTEEDDESNNVKSTSSHSSSSSSRRDSSSSSESGSDSSSMSRGLSTSVRSSARASTTGSGAASVNLDTTSGNVQDVNKLVLQLANLVFIYTDANTA